MDDQILSALAMINDTLQSILKSISLVKGDKGDKGDTGLRGLQGERGESIQGEKGDRGPQGLTGKPGESIIGPPGKDGSPDTPEQVVAKINASPLLIKADKIEGWRDLEKLAVENSKRAVSFSQIELGGNYTKDEVDALINAVSTGVWNHVAVSGTIDGSNATFTVSPVPAAAKSMILSLNRQIMIQDTDYTLSGGTITYTTPPDASYAGTPHRAQYQ